jgi:hypothetical protein
MKTEKDEIISDLMDELRIAKSRIKELEEENLELKSSLQNSFLLDLWLFMEPILNPIYKKVEIHLQKKFQEKYVKYKSIEISPKDIVFVITIKQRLKAIYFLKNKKMELFYEENNDHKLDWYCNSLDNLRHFLVRINRNVVVNTEYFELLVKHNLKPLFEFGNIHLDKKELSKLNKILTDDALDNFNRIKQGQMDRISLQEKLFHYK